MGKEQGVVLITGGAGFIGRRTAAALLQRGYGVRVLDSFDPQVHGSGTQIVTELDPAIEVQKGDVCSTADVATALKNVMAVFHFAAQTGVGQSMYQLKRYCEVNVTGTANLIEQIVTRGVKLQRFILSSSRAIYGEGSGCCPVCLTLQHPAERVQALLAQGKFEPECTNCSQALEPVPTPEHRPYYPTSIYGLTKLAQEDLCRQAAAAWGLPVTILRYFNVYGAGQALSNPYTGILPVFFNRLRAGQPVPLYEQGKPLRDFVHVQDVAAANILALETQTPPASVFNIGSGTSVTVRELAQLMAEIRRSDSELKNTSLYRSGDIFSCHADLKCSREVLGYAPQVELRQGLAEFMTWAAANPSSDQSSRAADELLSRGLLQQAGQPA